LLSLIKNLKDIREIKNKLDSLQQEEDRSNLLKYIKKVNLSMKSMSSEFEKSNSLVIKK